MFGKSEVENALNEFNDALAEMCVEETYGLSKEQIILYRRQLNEIKDVHSNIKRMIVHNIYEGDIRTNTLGDLETAVDTEIRDSQTITKTETFKKISEREVEDDELINTLRRISSDIAQSKYGDAPKETSDDIFNDKYETEWNIPGFFTFNDITVYSLGNINEVIVHKHENFKRLISDLKLVFSKYGSKATQYYFRDLLYTIDHSGIIGYGPKDDKYFLANFLGNGAFGIEDMLDGFRDAMDAYGIIYSNDLEDIANLLPLGNINKEEFTIFVSERICKFIGADKKQVRIVKTLLQKCDQEIRYAVLEAVSRNPETLELYKKLQKYQLTPEPFVNFLQYSINESLPDGRSSLHFLNEISNTPRLGPLAVLLMDSNFPWHQDQNLKKLVELADTRSDYEIIVKRYLNYSERNEENKKIILIKLSDEKSYSKIKDTLLVLDRIDNEKFREVAINSNSSQLVKTINEMSVAQSHVSKIQQRKSFLDIMWESLDKSNYGQFREASHALKNIEDAPTLYENRLRYAFMNHPDGMQKFVSNVVHYNHNQNFQLLLGNHILFIEYLKQLSADTNNVFSDNFDKAMQTTSGNPYRNLRNFLSPKHPYFEPEPERLITEEDISSISDYKRIIIYGGRFSTQIKERLVAASRLPIVINDIHRKGDILPREKDLAICLSSPNSHSAYYRIKNYCKKHRDDGIVFLHFNQRGFEPLIDFIKDKIKTD